MRQSLARAGAAWDIVAQPLIPVLDALAAVRGVEHAGLLGDHLHAITTPDAHTVTSLQSALNQAGFSEVHVEQAEVTLEDVFTEIAVGRGIS